MRRITASVFSIFVALPAFADARLPVVNVAAGSVSARAAFGDVAPAKVITPAAAAQMPAVSVAPLEKVAAVTPAPSKKVSEKVVARPARTPNVDAGQKIAASDVLAPRRPSSDLWARSDAPLRMPEPSEISVVRADYDLPEESLDAAPRATVTARAASVLAEDVAPLHDMDAEIAKLIELQRRADESVRAAKAAPASDVATIAQAPVASANVAPRATVKSRPSLIAAPVAAAEKSAPAVARADDAPSVATAPVSLSRMVVPMDEDVVVRTVRETASPKIAAVRDDMTKMSPSELRKAFRKTYLSENKHLSTYQIDDRFDVASDMSMNMEGFTASHDLSEAGGVRPLEIKIRFRGDDSALSRDNYNLLTEYASIVVSNPKRAIQISIPQAVTTNLDSRKLTARRLAIVEQVLRDTGVSEQRIMPVLSQRSEDGFVLRVISSDQYETLTQQQRNIFGDTVKKKTYKSMSW